MFLNEVLKWLGWMSLIGGVVIGIVVGNSPDPMLAAIDSYYDEEFRWSVAFVWIGTGITSSVIFFSICRALDFLQIIAENTAKPQQVSASSGEVRTSYPSTGKTRSSSLETLSKDHTFKSND